MRKKISSSKASQVQLLNGCYRSQFTVHPSNWKEAGASLKTLWYFSYRFYDPSLEGGKYKNGRQIIVKGGVNSFHTLMERRQVIADLLHLEKREIDEKGFNPITKQYMSANNNVDLGAILPPETPFCIAMKHALEKVDCTHNTRLDMRSVLKYTLLAAENLKYANLPIKDIRKGHIKLLLEECGRIKGERWSSNNYNHYRKYLMILFNQLIEFDTIEHNPVEKISKQKTIKRIRTILTEEQRKTVYEQLRATDYRFWLHMNIFFMAGCRRNELLSVRLCDIDFEQQKFKVVVKKGAGYREVEYTITDQALPLWRMAVVGAKKEDYIFSKGLVPGANPIRPEQVTRRWRKWVKLKMNIEADWYSLKHLHTTSISDTIGTKAAAGFNNESETMVIQHYDVNHNQRLHEQKKKVSISLSGESLDN